MCLSRSLEIIGRTEIGRELFGSEAAPDLPPMSDAKKGPQGREFDPKVLLKGGEIDIWL